MSDYAYDTIVEMRLSRHAKNKMRLYRLSQEDILAVFEVGDRIRRENGWESRAGNLRVIWVDTGPYAFVITVIRTDKP